VFISFATRCCRNRLPDSRSSPQACTLAEELSRTVERAHTVCMSKSVTAVGVLLAAGAGTRYGMPKVLAENGE